MGSLINKLLTAFFRVRDYLLKETEPGLLLFLLLMLNYRFSFKIAAIAGVYILRPNFKFKRDRIFFFYVLITLAAVVNYLFVRRDYSMAHTMMVSTGCLIWVVCLLSYHQVRLWVEATSAQRLLGSLKVLTLINFVVSAFDLVKIIFITGSVNPYTQISPPPYGISSGDLIGGVFGGMHLVNAVITCFLTLLFIYRESFVFALLSLVPFLLTGSNLGSIVLTSLLLYIFFLNKSYLRKYYAIICIAIVSLFYIKITPQNQKYMVEMAIKLQRQLTREKKTPEIHTATPVPAVQVPAKVEKPKLSKEELIALYLRQKHKNRKEGQSAVMSKQEESTLRKIYSYEQLLKMQEAKETDRVFYHKDSLKKAKLQSPLFDYGNLKHFNLDEEPGKLTSFKQTADYLLGSQCHAIFGSGVGSFSSRLAFVSSKLVSDSRILMNLPRYETREFIENHKAIFKYLMFLDDETHSIANLPFSAYNQMLGEYGLVGFSCFVLLYLGFFVKQFRGYTYGRIVFVAMLGFFLFDYWHERLSVMVFFELIMLLDVKLKELGETT